MSASRSSAEIGAGQRRGIVICAVGIVLAAAAVRLVASRDDFWLDEIWSWTFATQARSLLQIALGIRHDNNHVLNTWIIHLFPPETPWQVYRLPAVLAGVGTVILAGLCGARRSPCEGITALILAASSFVLIQYSSEARGYAYLLFFLMLCVWLGERIAVRMRPAEQWLFAVAASCGFLAHLSFAAAYVGLFIWTAVVVRRSGQSVASRLAVLLKMHLLPIMTLALLVVGSSWVIGGGDQIELRDVIVQAGSLAVGGPDGGPAAWAACTAVVAACVVATNRLRTHDQAVWWFWASTGAALALTILVLQPQVIYVRYFLILIMAALVLVAHLLAQIWNQGLSGRLIYGGLVATILAGNGIHLAGLLQYGRGDYQGAVQHMQANTSAAEISVGSDHDFRNPMVLQYYFHRLKNGKPLVYHQRGKWPPQGPEWVITHSFQQSPAAAPEVGDGQGNRYRRERVFPYSGLSGWNWILYHRLPREEPQAGPFLSRPE